MLMGDEAAVTLGLQLNRYRLGYMMICAVGLGCPAP